jgi:DNA-binding response OmpR family regulator
MLNKKILIVEDEVGISQFLKQGLEEENFLVDLAEDGLVGLNLALSKDYDLIILDWMLPQKNGVEICSEVRKQDNETPIIFLTAKDTIEETIEGLQSGANDYIKKPFHFEELLIRIKVQLRPKATEETELSIANVRLKKNTHQVFVDEKEVSLTKKEFSLLEYLLVNKGEVCKRIDIIKDVWDIHFEYNTGVIDVYINSLRKKLKLTTENDFIQTIRGVGYIIKTK